MKSLKEQNMEGKINPALSHLATGAKVRSNTCSDHDEMRPPMKNTKSTHVRDLLQRNTLMGV